MAKGLAVISGSNTVVFKALENGNITLGQDIAANVVVSGSLKLQVSGYAADKFLMSDAEGNATWVKIQASQIETGNGQDLETRLSAIEANSDTDLASLESRLSTEEATSRAAETSLEGRISTQISALVDGAPAVLDTLNEIAAALSNNPSFAADLATSIGSLESAISTETSRAVSAESLEANRAISAEGSLEGRISSEESVRASAVTSLEARLSSNVESGLSQEASIRASADASLETRLASEEAARAQGDSALSTALSGEVVRASSVEASLESRLSSEEVARASADASLEAKMDAEVSAIADNTITVNGTANEVEVDGGLSGVITLGDASSTITLGLPDDVVVSSSLTVNGDTTLGVGPIDDQLTIESKMRITLVDRTSHAAVLTEYADAANLAAGNFDGHMFYLRGDNVNTGMFQQGNKWYFCEGGVWHSSFFYVGS
jgi:hypothetical protein